MSEKVIRYLPAKIEVRSTEGEGESQTQTIGGYVVKFNQRSQLIWGEFYERVAKGHSPAACKRT